MVAVGVHDFHCTHDQAVVALYGPEAHDIATGQLTRRNDGVFGVDGAHPTGRQMRLSAVALISGLRVWTTPTAEITVYENPFAADLLPDDVLLTSRRYGAVDVGDGRALDWR